MEKKDKFIQAVSSGYAFTGETLHIGAAIFNGEPLKEVPIKIPLKTLNRHGLIAGATGTGKTKTLQVLAEELSAKSVSVLLMDIKGDLSGITMPGEVNTKVTERAEKTGIRYTPAGFPAELLTLSEQNGVRLRADVSEFGPVLFSKMLGLNDTQAGIVAILFKYADDNAMPLLDLADFKKLLQFAGNEGNKELEKSYGNISASSAGTILRKVIELEQQNAGIFFGEPSFEAEDLVRINEDGRGIINIIRLNDIQDKPKLFSTFMLTLLAEIYTKFPEEGDLDAPKLVIFIDEAHLIFKEASKPLLEQIETIVKLIRSKGVGIIFCTQNPTDIPDAVLSQLGLKIQHALRAFTAKDNKAIKQISDNYPVTEFYKTEDLLTSLGIGEAAVTALNEKGNPTPLAACLLRPPYSRMDVLTPEEISGIIGKSKLAAKYNTPVNRESAYEILTKKLEQAAEEIPPTKEKSGGKKEKSTAEKLLDNSVTRQMGRTAVREITRGIFGILGIKGGKKGFF